MSVKLLILLLRFYVLVVTYSESELFPPLFLPLHIYLQFPGIPSLFTIELKILRNDTVKYPGQGTGGNLHSHTAR